VSKSDLTDHGALQTISWVFENVDSLAGIPVTPVQPPGTLYIKLHTGDPGKDALDNPAVETDRQPISVAQPQTNISTDGRAQAITDTASVWLSVAADETFSHVSFWDNISAGNPWYKGPMVAPVSVLTGTDFVFPSSQTFDHS
jgi:hypothetical protein